MKKLLSAFILAATVASCSTDDTPFDDTVTPELVSPAFFMQVSTANGAQPFTGVVTISPLTNGTLQYFGNYVNRNLTPFSGYYFVKNGTLYEDKKNLELTLPLGTYDMVYWGTPKYEEPIYANPALREPSYSIGGDMSAQAFSLLQIPGDTTYYPTYDLAYAKRPVNVGTDDLDVALQRVVAGLKIIIKDRNDEMLHSGISEVDVRVTNIASQLNFATALPQGEPRTVSFPLVRSMDGKQMTNGIVMLFPSIGTPELQVSIKLQDGHVKSFKQMLEAPLQANTKLTLTLTVGKIFDEETSGDFTLEDWNETSEEIDVPVLE